MKTACFITNCSVDSALTLRRWVDTHSDETIRITVVHPYGVDAGITLNKETCRTAKQQATARLDHWLAMLPTLRNAKPETLFSSPELALKMYLLLRYYDYVLVDDQLADLPADFLATHKTSTLYRLNDHSYSLQPA